MVLRKQRIQLVDGRYLIYFTFEEAVVVTEPQSVQESEQDV